jgi:hypothetical protein
MTTMIIEDKSIQAKQFIKFARTLPFTTIVEAKKKSYEEAYAACGAVSVDTFFDELNARIDKWPDHA